MKIELSAVHAGDEVTVRCHSKCGRFSAGDHHVRVVDEDEISIAVEGTGGPWWFYRTGEAYCGAANIVTPNAAVSGRGETKPGEKDGGCTASA